VLRHGWGTKNETALWFVNGDFYHDHRHVDHGSVVLYALGEPLALDWGPTYFPQVPGAFLHNMVVPEASIGSSPGGPPPPALRRWDEDNTPLDTANFIWGWGPWVGSTPEAFAAFPNSAYARARFSSPEGRTPRIVWTRAVYSLYADPGLPLLLIRDTFAGEDARAGKVFTLNLMANGDVDTPAGKMSPPPRTWDHRDPNRQELPSAGPVFSLAPGLNRLGFTGQRQIDWDLYTVTDETQQAHVGNWAHTWHPHAEQAEFQKANGGRPFEERQHILRLKGSNDFTVLLLPYRKGEKPAGRRVTRAGENVVVTDANTRLLVGSEFYAYTSPQKQVLATFGAARAEAAGIRIEGGSAEVVLDGAKAILTAHGGKGLRRIILPGRWRAKSPLTQQGSVLLLDYPGGTPLTIALQAGTGASR
jgi:hypothetical protein